MGKLRGKMAIGDTTQMRVTTRSVPGLCMDLVKPARVDPSEVAKARDPAARANLWDSFQRSADKCVAGADLKR